MRKLLLVIGILFVVLVFFGLMYGVFEPVKNIQLAGAQIKARVAATPAQWVTGLSDTPSLQANSGMLFVFNHDGRWAFWMKDMRYPIDMLWLNAAKRVVSMQQRVSPQTYPKQFIPTTPSRYVLEVTSGFIAAHHVVIGAQALF